MELQSVSKGTNGMDPTSLLNPMDKQNVPYATELLRVINFSEKDDNDVLPFRLSLVAPGLRLVGAVFQGVLVLYAFISLGVSDTLETISTAMHILLCLFRKLPYILDISS